MRRILKKLLPAPVLDLLRRARFHTAFGFAERSYSQEGEDMVLRRLFGGQVNGFYVDVGAHHPRRFSNTYHFYKQGWRGINIEPNPDVRDLFRRLRPRDVNLTVGVSREAGTLTFFRFDEPALNTFDADVARERETEKHVIVDSLPIPVQRLDALLDAHLLASQSITFLTVDVEGHDLAVLQSNDWTRYRPACVLVEALSTNLSDIDQSPVHRFLHAQEYDLFAKTVHTLFYLERTGGAGSTFPMPRA